MEPTYFTDRLLSFTNKYLSWADNLLGIGVTEIPDDVVVLVVNCNTV